MNIFETTRELLRSSFSTDQIFAERVVSSTNDLAKDEAFDLVHRHIDQRIYVTDQQTKGRGRGQNSWLNPNPGDSLMITWSWALDRPAQAITGPIMGLHVYRALIKSFGNIADRISLKPPNDIYLDDKKILGLLAESMQQGPDHRLILGMGFNVLSSPREVPTANFLASAIQIDRENWAHFFQRLNQELQLAIIACQKPEISFEACNELLVAINKLPITQGYYRSVRANGDLETVRNELVSWRRL